jgi:hypothetical protein
MDPRYLFVYSFTDDRLRDAENRLLTTRVRAPRPRRRWGKRKAGEAA